MSRAVRFSTLPWLLGFDHFERGLTGHQGIGGRDPPYNVEQLRRRTAEHPRRVLASK